VLLVEDEHLLRMDAVDAIKSTGFDVVEAANADDAIEILEVRRDIVVVFRAARKITTFPEFVRF
jgi:DNA-binding response OmpR family regulator